MDDPEGLYADLGVKQDATKEQIVKAFRKRALKEHPDKGGDAEKFKLLAHAYSILSDDKTRQRYDIFGDTGGAKQEASAADVFVNAFFGEDARASDSRCCGYGLHSVGNYERVDIEKVSEQLKDIVKLGLNYLISLDLCPDPSIVLLQHTRIDVLYVMAVYAPPLTQESFDDAYVITYYDSPLQAGIAPKWSDQNVLNGQGMPKNSGRRELSENELRDRVMNDPGIEDPLDALEERYARLHLKS